MKLLAGIGTAASALVLAACGQHGMSEDQVRVQVERFMSEPGAPVSIVAVPSCSKGDRKNEWRCRVRARMPSTGERFDLTVIASCAAERCELARNDWTGYGPSDTPWKAVIDDWYDGGIDHRHSCAAVQAAIAHLPADGGSFSTARRDLEAYERKVC